MNPDFSHSVSHTVNHPIFVRILGGLVGAGTLGFWGAIAGLVLPFAALQLVAHSIAVQGGNLDKPGAGWLFLGTAPAGALLGVFLGAVLGATSPSWPVLGGRLLLGALAMLLVAAVVCYFLARGALA